jgi:hypothetical protein
MSERRCSQCGQIIPDSTPALRTDRAPALYTANEARRALGLVELLPTLPGGSEPRLRFADIWHEPFDFSKAKPG